MKIKFRDIEDRPAAWPGAARIRVGCLAVRPSGGWTAACPGLEFSTDGEGGLGELPPGAIWIVDGRQLEVMELRESHPDLNIRTADWMLAAPGDMDREWGVGDIRDAVGAGFAATLLDRILKVAVEAAVECGLASPARPEDLRWIYEKSPSLATGLRNLYSGRLDADIPKEGVLGKRMAASLIQGVYRHGDRDAGDRELLIHCRLPGLGHAIRATSPRVPGAGRWRRVEFPARAPFGDRLAELRRMDLPVVFVGRPVRGPGGGHGYFDPWVGAGWAGGRIVHTLDEVEALSTWFGFAECEALVGPGWRESLTGGMVGGLVAVCGGVRAASASWSANMAAANILSAGIGSWPRSGGLPPERLWLSARDRLEMARPARALLDRGATLVSAHAGSISVRVAADRDAVSRVAETIWDCGLHVPPGTARLMRETGVELPPWDAHRGAPEDRVLARMSADGLRRAMWEFDGVLERPAAERAAAFAALLR